MGLIGDLFVRLGVKDDGFKKGMEDAGKKTDKFGGIVNKIGPLIAGAFAVDKLKQFITKAIELASKAEGIELAFNRLGDPKLLQGLRDSVKGTVSDVELMQKAVQAKNLGVPIQELGKLFEFATQRASDTGESVDYLVNSIVTGIGRKSPLILDNLGISAIALKDNLNGVGLGAASVGQVAEAVGKIIDKEMGNAESATLTFKQSTDQLSASWDNVSTAIGKAFTQNTSFISGLSKVLQFQANQLESNVSWWKKLSGVTNIYQAQANILRDKELKGIVNGLIEQEKVTLLNYDAINKIKDATDKQIVNLKLYAKNILLAKKKEEELIKTQKTEQKTLAKLRTELKNSQTQRESLAVADEEGIRRKNIEIAQIKEQISELENLGRAASGLEKIKGLDISSAKIQAPEFNVEDQLKTSSSITKEAMDEMRANLEEFIDLTGAVQNAVFDLAMTIGESVGQAFTGLFKWESLFDSIKGIFGNFLTEMGAAMISYGVAMLALQLAPINPIGAIGAGIALVAAGTLISSMGAKGPFGSGSGGGPSPAPAPTQVGETGIDQQTLVAQVNGEELQFVLERTNSRQQR